MHSENGQTTTFNVPSTLSELKKRGNLIAVIIDQREWERAASIRAWTVSKQGTRTDLTSPDARRSCATPRCRAKDHESCDQRMSFTDFAKLKIPGLTNAGTVAHYYRAWDLTNLPEPEPGQTVGIPRTLEFPRQKVRFTEPDTSSLDVDELEAAIGSTDDDPDYNPEPSGDKPSDIRQPTEPPARQPRAPREPAPRPIEGTILDEIEGLLANCDMDMVASEYTQGSAITLIDSISNMLTELKGKYTIRAVPRQRNRRKNAS